jgi:PST family polysaccharide transporter
MKINLSAQVVGYALPATVLALLGFGVWALVVAMLLQWGIKAGLLCLVTRGRHAPCYSAPALREMLSFGFGITKEKIWNYVIGQGDRFIIGRRLGAEALGQYHVMAVALLPTRYFGDVMDNVFFPVMARMRDDRARLASTWLDLVSNCFVFMFGVGVFLSANGEAIVRLAFGERWLESAPVFRILCLGAGFTIVTRLSDALNRALGQVHQTARRKMANAMIFVPVVWFGAGYGLTGVCVALVSMQVLNAVFQCQLACEGLGSSGGSAHLAIRRALSGAVVVFIVNGVILAATAYVEIREWLELLAAVSVNLIAGALFFKPLMTIWRNNGLPPPGDTQ